MVEDRLEDQSQNGGQCKKKDKRRTAGCPYHAILEAPWAARYEDSWRPLSNAAPKDLCQRCVQVHRLDVGMPTTTSPSDGDLVLEGARKELVNR